MSYDRFRHKEEINTDCINKIESSFILEGTSSVIIRSLRLNRNKKAALIIDDKEGPDTAIVFTYKERTPTLELLKSDYFTWNDHVFLVYEDVNLVRDVLYKKQRSYQCNVTFTIDDSTYYGYFVSSLARYVDTTMQHNLNITDNEKPILILPLSDDFYVGQKIVIGNKPYKIIDFDAITNNGIMYCSLDRDFVQKQEDIVEEPIIEDRLTAGIEITLPTAFGYFKANTEVELIKKTLTAVTFAIPYGVDNITITTKDNNKNDIIKTYKVVI